MKKMLLLLFFFIATQRLFATPVMGITAFYRSGQVFVTWNNLTITGVHYNLYRSSVPITLGAQLDSAQNLGWVPDSSAINRRMTEIAGGVINILSIDSLGAPLSVNTGLFVATSTGNGNFYYAVTTTVNGVEDTTIIAGENSITAYVPEQVTMPMPVLQKVLTVKGLPIQPLYVQFLTSVTSNIYPRMTNYGSIPQNFSILEIPGTPPYTAFYKLHGGAANFIADTSEDTLNGTYENAWDIGLDDWTSGGAGGSTWIGYNQNDNVNAAAGAVPTSGWDMLFTQINIAYTIQWINRHLPVDSTKNIVYGESDGGVGTIYTFSTIPEQLSLAYEYTGMFNLAFSDDPNGYVATNTGEVQRKNLNYLFGLVSTNLLDNEGLNFYNQSNADYMAHLDRDKNYPVLFGINGKNDQAVGWYEKVAFYDSANANRLGGFFYWDERSHGSGPKAWNIIPNYSKYSTSISYPAFSNCSANNNPGDGYNNTGDSVGTINGMLDWKSEIVDSPTVWQTTIYIRKNVKTIYDSFPTPDSLVVDITPRRLQNFKPMHGATIYYQNINAGFVLQSGTASYDGDLIVIPKQEIYSDTNILRLTIDASSIDTETSIPIQVTATDTVQCDGANDTLTASGASTYSWTASPSYGSPFVGIGPVIIVTPTVTTIYTVTGKNSNGIPGAQSVVVDIPAAFNANITTNGPSVFCPGNSVELVASPTGSNYSYQWYGNGKALAGATESTYTTKKAGTAYVVMTSSLAPGCPSTSNSIKVTAGTYPVDTIMALDSTGICVGTDSVELSATTGTGYTYQWYINNTVITGATSSIYYADDADSYTCNITNSSGCISSSNTIMVTAKICSIKGSGNPYHSIPYTSLHDFNVTPNPDNGNFYLTYNAGKSTGDISIEIINLLGQVIYTQSAETTGGLYNTQIYLPQNSANGCYLVKVVSRDNEVAKQITVVK